MIIWIYRILWLILLPIVAIWLTFRVFRGKEDASRLRERFGFCGCARPSGKVVWIHASSVGECMSVLPFVKRLVEADEGLNIVITSGTRTSAEILASRLPQIDENRLFHAFAPMDFAPFVCTFLRHWRPVASIFVESELWPELLTQAPSPVLLNGRISDRSFPRYKKYSFVFKPLIGRFEACLAQSRQDAERLEELGAKNVSAAGNIKFDAEPLAAHERELLRIQKEVEGRKVVVFASTHGGEEELFVDLHKSLKEKVKGLLTVIVPRHPERGGEVVKVAAKVGGFGVPERGAGYVHKHTENMVYQRSLGFVPSKACEVYVADSLGELGVWFRVADAVVMGGSFVDLGKVSGHNPVEPLRLFAPTIVGKHMDNFAETMEILQGADVLPQVKDIQELSVVLERWLNADIRDIKRRKEKIKAAMIELSGSIDAAVKMVGEIVGK